MAFVLISSSNHTPIKYRCRIERSSQGAPTYVVPYNKECFESKAKLKHIIDLLNLQCYTYTPPPSGRLRFPPTPPSATRPSFHSLIGCLHLATGQWWVAPQVFGGGGACNYGFCYKPPSPSTRSSERRDLLNPYKTNMMVHHLVDLSSFFVNIGWMETMEVWFSGIHNITHL